MIPVVLNSTQLNPLLYSTQLKVIRWGPDWNTVSISSLEIETRLMNERFVNFFFLKKNQVRGLPRNTANI